MISWRPRSHRADGRSGHSLGRDWRRFFPGQIAVLFDQVLEEFGIGRASRHRSTSIPSGANSARSDSLNPASANLLAQYSLLCGHARRPRTEPMFTTIGVRPCRNSGSATRINSTGAKKFVSMIGRRRVGSASAKRPWALVPALLTRMSRPPSFSCAVSTARRRTSESVTSPTTASARRPNWRFR